jgi:Ca-activated chloride channel family protein
VTPELKHLWALGLLALPLALAVLAWRWRRHRPGLVVATAAALKHGHRSLRSRLSGLPLALRLLALGLLALAIARPRLGERFEDVITEGVDVVFALDVSGSMRAEDLRPKNRLHVAKEVIGRFVDGREHDRLGLVAFAGKAFTQCPLTLDYGLLKQVLAGIGFDTVDEDGTAIGLGLTTALNRLRGTPAQSKVVVLVTDGINNRGAIDPFTAAEAARALGVKVYTVGVGTRGRAPIPVQTDLGVQYVYQQLPLDEEALKRIATSTGGYYFRATDTTSFEEALRRIGELEKSRIETRVHHRYDELFAPFAGAAALLLAVEGLLGSTWLRRLP